MCRLFRRENRLQHFSVVATTFRTMSLLVPFDGSELAESALVRAAEFGHVFEEEVIAVSVIPRGNARYARDHGWIAEDEPFDLNDVVSTLHEQVTDRCPTADFRHVVVDRYATHGTIANRLREFARDEDVSMVFIGSDNAGRFVSSLGSVGSSLAAEQSYDVVIVRDRAPSRVEKIRESSPYRTSKSDFYLPG